MRSKSLPLLMVMLVLGAALAAAQTTQSLILEFIDGDDLTVVLPDKTTYTYKSGSIQEDDTVPVGATIRTGPSTSVELRLKPNGTLVKIAKATTFRVDGLATAEKQENAFTLVAGRLRAVAVAGSTYSITTSNTVAGVRGTDFSMAFEEGKKATLLVQKGAVEYYRRAADGRLGESIMVGAGQFADFFGGFVAAAFSPDQLASENEGLDIDPSRMPAQPEPAAEPAAEASAPADAAAADFTAAGEGGTETSRDPEDTGRAVSKTESAIMDWLSDVLGMEIGSITINGETWAKAVIQPTFNLGKLRMGLYLPVIYSKNLFDPADWYHPNGNDEWSFGTDVGWTSETWLPALGDAVTDLALKVKFFEYGEQLKDPFFIKVGNLDTFTVGHGLVMRNYANDADFPSIRHVGINLGLDMESWGFEALTNDITDNEIVGGRVYLRPIPASKLAIGLSGVADLHPASVFNDESVAGDEAALYGDPIFIGSALDLDLPIISSDIFGIRFFADGAAMVPVLRNDSVAAGARGIRFDMLYDAEAGTVQNWGASSGFLGNVLFIDWRLEYRYYTGAFTPSFFDSSYERRRADVVREWASYLSGATEISQAPSVMGIYGEGGFSILKDKLSLTFGYFWPWSMDPDVVDFNDQIDATDDFFVAKLVLLKGLVPVIDVQGSISYERTNFIDAIVDPDGGMTLFDENTTFSGEVAFPVPGTSNLDLAFIVSTAMKRDAEGDVEYDAGSPVIVPVVTLETRLHF